jgi:SAM-dependent methyltransferase
MTVTTPVDVSEERLESFGEEVFAASLGALELTVMAIGRELGLYSAMRARGTVTASDIAAEAGVDARYTREWMEHQAVAHVIVVDDPDSPPDDRRYVLPEEHAIALLDEDHPAYVGALADLSPIIARSLGHVMAAFRTGSGVPFAAYELHDMQAGFTRPMFANSLTTEWLPALEDFHRRLEAGEPLRVLDLGCGEGWAAIYLAEAYPAVRVDGFDLDDISIARAREHASQRGVSDRVAFEVRDVTDTSIAGHYDLAMCCEVIHDLPDPVSALATMRRVTRDGGEVLVIDERVAESFSPSGDPMERLMYAISILHCLPAGRDAETSVATGTVMRPDTFRAYAAQAGFGSVEELAIDHPMFRFYHPVG